jgi:hypothetical protein
MSQCTPWSGGGLILGAESGHSAAVAKAGDETRSLEQSHCFRLLDVDYHHVIGVAVDEEGDHAVVTGARVLVRTLGTVDGESPFLVGRRIAPGHRDH